MDNNAKNIHTVAFGVAHESIFPSNHSQWSSQSKVRIFAIFRMNHNLHPYSVFALDDRDGLFDPSTPVYDARTIDPEVRKRC